VGIAGEDDLDARDLGRVPKPDSHQPSRPDGRSSNGHALSADNSGPAATRRGRPLGRVDGFDQDEAGCKSHERTVVERGFLAS
jgi:hypothetical protein